MNGLTINALFEFTKFNAKCSAVIHVVLQTRFMAEYKDSNYLTFRKTFKHVRDIIKSPSESRVNILFSAFFNC